jgi:hypothetical protein
MARSLAVPRRAIVTITRSSQDAAPAFVRSPVVSFERHVRQQTVVLPEQRILFLPVPKAACTSLLWGLADLAGLPASRFSRSGRDEPTAALTIHDMSLWDQEHRLAEHDLDEDGWLRFTVVRDPWTRLWSAWQSKLLLREPRFHETFGEREWFPRVPGHPREVVTDFRRFLAAVAAGGAADVHWAPQLDLVRRLPLNHVGLVERLGETLARVERHAGRPLVLPAAENAGSLPLPPHAFATEVTGILRERYRADLEAFGYPLDPPVEEAADWERRAGQLLPAIRARIDDHDRVAQLHRLARRRADRVHTVEKRLAAVSARRVGRSHSTVLTNREGHDDFTVRWGWAEDEVRPGFTAVVRVRDEAATIGWVLSGLFRAAERVVLVDNGSTDGTADVARRTAHAAEAADRLDVVDYPFAVARCGEEHLATPADSVHSLAYFYNWAFSHVRTAYALKWDGDMVLTDGAVAMLRDLAWQLEGAEAVVRVPRTALYVADERLAHLDTGLRNCEPWAWPNRAGYWFVKALEWELPMFPADVATVTLPEHSAVEVKHLAADEFAHWSSEDFTASPRTARKLREKLVFDALRAGTAPPAGVIPIRAAEGRHVIDHVRSPAALAAAVA